MAVYLMQHGEATTEAENAARPLTETGRAVVERVAARANAADVRIDRCVHSGKLRAEQTADVLLGALESERIIEPVTGWRQTIRLHRWPIGLGTRLRAARSRWSDICRFLIDSRRC